jgi:hypothetical protein
MAIKFNRVKILIIIALIAMLFYAEWGLETSQNKSLLPNHGYSLPIGWQQNVPFAEVACVGPDQSWPFITYRENDPYCDVNKLAGFIDVAAIVGFFIGLPILAVELADRAKKRLASHE